ncbi:hypothetical protein V5F38_10400 [Xanthobacter sp. V0B-10]|uniref:hypothetical protein n=1 Tax=Xanthobacter albus TaxID=3119929 RepID=UPI003726BE64
MWQRKMRSTGRIRAEVRSCMPGPVSSKCPAVASSSIIKMLAAAAQAGDKTGEKMLAALRDNLELIAGARSWWTRSMIEDEAVSITFMKTAAAHAPCAGTNREPRRPEDGGSEQATD